MGYRKLFKRCIEHTPNDPKPVLGLLAKLFEEGGETAEATLHCLGYLPHKTMKEPLVGEIADVILCAVALYARLSQEEGFSTETISDDILASLETKMSKWEAIPPLPQL